MSVRHLHLTFSELAQNGIKAGEKQELSSSIHAEQIIITEAARKGISLEDTKLYITSSPVLRQFGVSTQYRRTQLKLIINCLQIIFCHDKLFIEDIL